MKESSWTIAHDFAYVFGGAELVTRALARAVADECDPEVLFLAGDRSVTRQISPRARVLLPRAVTSENYRYALPLYPFVTRTARPVSGNLLVSSYAFSHHLRCTGRKVVYCHSPLRQIWSGLSSYTNSGQPFPQRTAIKAFGPALRRVDKIRAMEASQYVATSVAVKRRIESFYGIRDVPIVAPPIDFSDLHTRVTLPRDGLLWVGRVTEPYKQLGFLCEAMRLLPDLSLTVVGDGRDLPALIKSAPRNVRFLGWTPRTSLAEIYSSHKLLIFPSEDDFGITPVEAHSCGTPVVAYGSGGALDTVAPGVNGLFFQTHEVAELCAVIRRALSLNWDHAAIAARARQTYSFDGFVSAIRNLLELG